LFLNNKYEEAAFEFNNLKDISKGNDYFFKSSFFLALSLYKSDKFEKSLNEVNFLLKEKLNYNLTSDVLYLSGLLHLKKNNIKFGLKNFLEIYKDYNYSKKYLPALCEIINIYIAENKLNEAAKFILILKKNYPDSEQYNNFKNLIDLSNFKNEEIVYSENNSSLKNDELQRIKTDLTLSIDNIKSEVKLYYIQLAYLSNYENALLMVDNFKRKKINDVFISKTKSNSSGNVFYRIVIGPFFDKKESKKRSEELKKNSIDNIVMELVKKND